MSISTILFFVFVLLFTSLIGVRKLGNFWFFLPHFVCNYKDGKLAICSITDYNSADAEGSVLDDKVAVRDTLVFSMEKSKYVSGEIELINRDPFPPGAKLYLYQKTDTLFVPFASEEHMTYEEQEKFFTSPQNIHRFTTEKMWLNVRNDYRLRVVEFVQGRAVLDALQTWSFLAVYGTFVISFFSH